MTLKKRDGRWHLDYYDERAVRVRRSTGCRDLAAARMIEAQVLRAVELRRAGVMVADAAAASEPVLSLVRRYADSLDQRGQHAYITRLRLERAANERRWRRVADITPQSVILHLDSLAVAARTRNQVRQSLRSWCQWMLTQRPPVLSHNPVDHVPVTPDARNPMRWPLADAEFEALLAAGPPRHATGRRNWPMRRLAYMLAGEAGLRRSDARHLVAARVRLDGLAPFVELPAETTKGRRWEQVPLTARLAAALAERVGTLEPADRVLPGVPSVAALRADLVRAGVDPANPVGLDVDYHTLRHTFVARLLRRGVPLKQVQLLARHRDVNTTLRVYGQLGLGDALEGIAALGVPVSVPVGLHESARDPRKLPRMGGLAGG